MAVPLYLLAVWAARRFWATRSWYGPELLSLAVFSGFLLATWLVLLPALVLSYEVSMALGTVGLAVLLIRWRPQSGPVQALGRLRPAWRWTTLASTMVALAYATECIPPWSPDWTVPASAWADTAWHLTLIRCLAAQPHFVAHLPILSGAPLTYHFLIDLVSVLLCRSGLPIGPALALPGLLLGLSGVQALFFAAARLWHRGAAGALAVALFFLGGSTAGLVDFVHHRSLAQDWSNQWDRGLYFGNVVVQAMLPQRPMLWAIPAVAWTLVFLVRRRVPSPWGLVVGLLPLAHLQAWAACLALLIWHRQVRPAGVAVLVALPQLAWLFLAGPHESFVHLHVGWMATGSWLGFWLRNLGPAFVFLGLASVWLLRRRRPWFIGMALPCLAGFALVNLVSLQPADYDNIKILFFVYMGVCVASAGLLLRPLAVPIVLLWVVPGLLSHAWALSHSKTLLTAGDVSAGQRLAGVIPPPAVVLYAPTTHSPLSLVAGRGVVLGFGGWIYSYGIPFKDTERDVNAMLAGNSALLVRYGVDYVVDDKQSAVRVNQAFYRMHYPVVLDDERWTVYRIKS